MRSAAFARVAPIHTPMHESTTAADSFFVHERLSSGRVLVRDRFVDSNEARALAPALEAAFDRHDLLALAVAVSTVLAPLVSAQPSPVTVGINGQYFINNGLVGVGRIPAATKDKFGETFGSGSGMTVDPQSWRRRQPVPVVDCCT